MSQSDRSFLRTLFLHPPSYDGFDGGAGARYQARREVRSFWYPTWLAQPAALVPGSRLIDAPPQGLAVDQLCPLASDYDLAVLHTSTPSFEQDVRVAEALKASNASLRIGFVGAHVAVDPERALARSNTIEFVARNEFDFTIREVAQDRPLDTIPGLSFRKNGGLRHTPERPILENMDELPFVVEVYKRDLVVEHYAIGYLLHPYLSLYTGRGCRSKCTFCLWPQTVGGHRYRTRSVGHVTDEIALATRYFPQVREYFFDDDTLTDDLPRIEALARRLGKLGVTWSCNAKADVPYSTLRVLKDNGLRLLLVGYESGNQRVLNNVKKGIRLDNARRFTKSAKALGIKIHGTFILGLPGESRETIEETIRFAQEIDPDTVQVSIAAPYPGTELYRQAVANGWLEPGSLVDDRGAQVSALSYPNLLSSEISRGTQEFYRRFYFRPGKIFSIARRWPPTPVFFAGASAKGASSFSSCGRAPTRETSGVRSPTPLRWLPPRACGAPGACRWCCRSHRRRPASRPAPPRSGLRGMSPASPASVGYWCAPRRRQGPVIGNAPSRESAGRRSLAPGARRPWPRRSTRVPPCSSWRPTPCRMRHGFGTCSRTRRRDRFGQPGCATAARPPRSTRTRCPCSARCRAGAATSRTRRSRIRTPRASRRRETPGAT